MTEKPLSRGEKAAKTLLKKNPRHFKEIAAAAGKKTVGTFRTKRGLAKKAGIKSGKARKIKAVEKEISNLQMAIHHLPAEESEHEQSIIFDKQNELDKLKAEYAGLGFVEDKDGTIMEYLQ